MDTTRRRLASASFCLAVSPLAWADFQAATGCYDSGTPTLVTMNGDMGAFDGTLSGCEIKAGDAVYVMAETTSGLPNISSTQSLRINWICIW